MTQYDDADAELLRKLAQDVDLAFDQLVATYHPNLLRFAHSQVHSPENAQDVMQDCWQRIYQALKQYSQERILSLKLRNWLFTIVGNQTRTYLASQKKNMLMISSIELFKDDSWEPISDRPFDEDMLERILRQDVKNALQNVSLAPRMILQLYLLDELTYEEIAQRMQKPISVVRAYVSRGLHQLRELLKTEVS